MRAYTVLLAFLLGCSCDPSRAERAPESRATSELGGHEPASREQEAAMKQITYQGPELDAELTRTADDPPAPVVDVRVVVPSGGYALEHDETRTQDGVTQVLLTLVSPGPGEMVTMAFETKRLAVRLGEHAPPVQILVSQRQRGVSYIQRPPYELAKVVKAN